MKVSIDISLHPLTEAYEQVVIDFIDSLKKHPELDVRTNGLSTQVFGDYDQVMSLMSTEIKQALERQKAVVVLKLAAGTLTTENLPESLR
jgi:uncharacterized protein YqgV (UPF0045/DUF77 family)